MAHAEAHAEATRMHASGPAVDAVSRAYPYYVRAFQSFVDAGRAEQAARFIAALRDFWWARHWCREGLDWAVRVLALPTCPSWLARRCLTMLPRWRLPTASTSWPAAVSKPAWRCGRAVVRRGRSRSRSTTSPPSCAGVSRTFKPHKRPTSGHYPLLRGRRIDS